MSLESELFKLIDTNNYREALLFAEHTSNLDINALDHKGRSFFFAAAENNIGASQERYQFIEYLMTHPGFTQANTPLNDSPLTPFRMILKRDDMLGVHLIIKYKNLKNIEVVFHENGKLLYELQSQTIDQTQIYFEKHPHKYTAASLEKKNQILASLLNAAVRHAIQTDDPSLLQRLADAGARLYCPLEDGIYPMDLVQEKPELKVHEWLTKTIQEYLQSSPVLALAARGLMRKRFEQQLEIVRTEVQNTREAVKRTFKFFNYEEALPKEEALETSAQHKTSGRA